MPTKRRAAAVGIEDSMGVPVMMHENDDGTVRLDRRLASPHRRSGRLASSWKKRRRTQVYAKRYKPWEPWEKCAIFALCWFCGATALGPAYVDGSARVLECVWWLARVALHRAFGTFLLVVLLLLHLISYYRILLVRSYVLIWWRLEAETDTLDLEVEWTQTLTTALRRMRRFYRAGCYAVLFRWGFECNVNKRHHRFEPENIL